LEAGFEAADIFKFNREKIKKKSPVSICCQRNQFTSLPRVLFVVNILDVSSFAAKRRPIIDNLGADLSFFVIENCHCYPICPVNPEFIVAL